MTRGSLSKADSGTGRRRDANSDLWRVGASDRGVGRLGSASASHRWRASAVGRIGQALAVAILALPTAAGAGELDAAVAARDLARARSILEVSPEAVNERDSMGRTPLHTAANRAQLEMVTLLLEHAAVIGAVDNVGMTPLILGTVSGHTAVVELLLQRGADPSAAAVTGETALHWAADTGRVEIAGILLTAGAKVEAQDKNGWTPLIRAAKEGHEALVARLIEAGADPTRPWALVWAAGRGHLGIIITLIEQGADVNAAAVLGRTPLHLAAIRGKEEAARILLARGADPRLKDQKGLTALDHAREQGHTAVVSLLTTAN